MIDDVLSRKWKVLPINDVVKWGSGGTPKAGIKEYYENGTIPWLIIGDLNDGIVKKAQTCITPKGLENSSAKIIPKGTLLVAMYGSIGKLGITGMECCTNQAIAFVKESKGVCTKFLFYYMMHVKPHLIKMGKGGTQRNISQTVLKSLNIPVPHIQEQERIVSRIEELFSELENGIENLKKAKAQLGIYKQAVLKEAFEGKLTHNHYDVTKYMCKINAYRNDNGYKIKYSMMEHFELPQIPDSWKWCCIGDIATKSEYGTSKKSSKMGKVPVIRMGNIQNGKILWNDLVFSNDDDEIKQYMVKKGDVLFNRTNSPELVGKTAIFSDDREALFAGYLIRINQVPMINAKYLNYFLNSPIARQYGNLVKTDGVNQSNINSKKMYSYPFPLCTEKEQLEIVEEIETRLSVCENIEKTVDTALEQAEIMRQSILKQAFEGRL